MLGIKAVTLNNSPQSRKTKGFGIKTDFLDQSIKSNKSNNCSKTRKVVVMRKKIIDDSGRIVNSNRIEDIDREMDNSL